MACAARPPSSADVVTQTEPSHRVRELSIRQIRPGDEHDLEVLFAGLDTRWFRPHDLGESGAREVASHVGKDAYLIGHIDSVPVAYGMLRGWDEGYRIPALGIARLFIAGDGVIHAFPRTEEIEAAVFLLKMDRLVDHALQLIIVAKLDEAGEREVLAQRVPLEAVIGEDAPEIGVP